MGAMVIDIYFKMVSWTKSFGRDGTDILEQDPAYSHVLSRGVVKRAQVCQLAFLCLHLCHL